MILTIIIFLLVIGVLVLVHEFGHFIMAKKAGVKVEEFAIGFPPRLFSKKKGETVYSINAIPLGGYVKMLGELEHSSSPRAFENQTPGKRFMIAIAGVLMNVLLAWFILMIGFAVGMSPLASPASSIPGKVVSSEILIAGFEKDSPAEKAGLQVRDIVIGGVVNNNLVEFKSIQDLQNFTAAHKGEKIKIKYKRDNAIAEKELTAANGDAPLGVSIVENSIVRVPWYKAPYVALTETFALIKLTYQFFGAFIHKLFSTGEVEQGVGGPVQIYVLTGLAIQAGIMVLLQFVALLSINLAIINILPFPALDGGRLVFIALEKLFRRKVVQEKVENTIHMIGYALLILLIVAITYRDIVNLFHK